MYNSAFLNKTSEITKWISNLALINILWLFFTIIGGIVLGFLPATTSMVLTIKRLRIKQDINIRKEFIHNYKKEFRNSNRVFYPFIIVYIILAADINFVVSLEHELTVYFVNVLYVFSLILVMLFLYSLSLYTSDVTRFKSLVKKSFNLLLTSPITNIYIAVSSLLILIISEKITGFIVFFSGSLFSLILIIIVTKTVKLNKLT